MNPPPPGGAEVLSCSDGVLDSIVVSQLRHYIAVSPKGSHHLKKNLFCEKVSQTGGGGHLDFIPLFFLL